MTTKCPICLNEIADNLNECPACGFKFSGQTQKFQPINSNIKPDINNRESDNSYRSSKVSAQLYKSKAVLRVVSGPQGELILPITKNKMSIGRSQYSDIFLNDWSVSRDHAYIVYENSEYKIIDRDSYNGIWINNKNISVAKLNDGDIMQIGVFFLKFEIIN